MSVGREIERLPDDYLYENSAETLNFYLYSSDTHAPLEIGSSAIVKWSLARYSQKGYKTDLRKIATLSTDTQGRTLAQVKLTADDTAGRVGTYIQQLTVIDQGGSHVIAQGHIDFFVNIDVN